MRHDLLAGADLFGLVAAADGDRGHFPGMGPQPLAVQDGAQAAVAVFDAEGFESAAVAMISAVAGAVPPPPRYTVRHVEAAFDRPFGFLTVHRMSCLVLNAGWVADPVPYPQDTEPWDTEPWDTEPWG
ncbi:hypothetical protein [Streptomyces sp. KLOTTS4A1]|uniref:hypothetical protein n=1 Tax=Streptomyces sp. KLOTTS4A1 TaxID=3390996 RepID=UPI0039F581E2